jgi:hypothetical protein
MNNNFDIVHWFAKKLQTRVIIQRIVFFYLLTLSFFFVFTFALNALFFFSPLLILPFIWDYSVLALCITFFLIAVYHFFFRRPDLKGVLSDLEIKTKLRHPVTAISLEFTKDPNNVFIEQVFSTAATQVTILEKNFPPVVKNNKTITLFLTTFILVIPTLFLPSNAVRYWRFPLITMNQLSRAEIYPGTITVPKSKPIILKFAPQDRSVPFCRLTLKSLNNKLDHQYLLQPDSLNQFSFNIGHVDKSLIYQFVFANRSFKPDTITVMPPPSLFSLKASIKPPSYTGGKIKKLHDGQGDFNAYAGSEITLEVQSNPLKKASVIFNRDSIPMSLKNDTAFSIFSIHTQGTYTFTLTDTFNQANDSLPHYHIDIIPDEVPVVQIVTPGHNKDLTPALLEPIRIVALDDFGISSVILNWYKSSEKDTSYTMNISASVPTISFVKEFNWNLSNSHLYPGDTAYYWVSVIDNWPFSPKHLSISDTFWFRIPGFDEIQKSITDKENQAESTIKNVRENQKELEKTTDELTTSESTGKEMSWESKQKIDELKEGLKSQADSLKSALEALDKSAEQLKNTGSIGEELSRKMDQVQKMIQDLIKQYGDSLFSELNKPQNIGMEEMKEAIANIKEMLPELGKRLDNTLQFLETLKQDRQIASLAMKAENLAREQAELSKENNSKNSRETQSDLLEKISELQESFNSDLNEEQNSAVKKTCNALDSLKKKMHSSLQSSQLPEKESMNSMGESLLSLSDELKQMMSNSQMVKMEKERNTILEMANDVITLSDWQTQIRLLPDEEINSKESAILQQTINDALKKVMSRTDSLSVIPPQIMQQLREQFTFSSGALQQVLLSFSQINNKSTMKQSSNSLQSLANTLLNTASAQGQQQSGNSGGGGGLMSGLRKLSQQQAGVNAATSALLQNLMNGLKGNQPGQLGEPVERNDANEKARQEAQEAQRKIADELDKLIKKYGNSGHDQSATKRLDELSKEAHRLAEMLSKPHSDVRDKQNQFLTRMLQSALSMNKRDEKNEERKSEISKSVFSGKSVSHSDNELLGPDAFYMLKRKALQGIFPENYRSAVNAYFDSLGVIYLKDKD